MQMINAITTVSTASGFKHDSLKAKLEITWHNAVSLMCYNHLSTQFVNTIMHVTVKLFKKSDAECVV